MSFPKYSFELIKAERRSRFDPLKDLDGTKLSSYLDEFRAGHLRNLALVMEAIEERDDTLASVVPKAKSAVARHGWEILTVDTETPEQDRLAQEQKKVLEEFYNNVTATSAMDQDEIGGARLLFRQMMDAKGKRYSVHNIVWRSLGNGRYTATFHHIPLWFFENTEGRMRFIEQPYGYYGEDMEHEAWLVTKGHGLMIPCSVAWMYKHLPLRDWLIYCARHGMPGIEGVTDEPEGSEEWSKLATAVEKAATEFAWVRSRKSEINTIQFGAAGDIPFPPLIERMDRAMAALWRGADLSTISRGNADGAGASLQGEEGEILEMDDAEWISETLNYKVDRLVLDFVFGRGTPALAYMKISADNKQDVRLDLEIDQRAMEYGHPISQQQFAERYNRPIPDEGDPRLILQTPTMPGVPGGTAFNEAQPAALSDRVSGELGVPASWLEPVEELLADLERKAKDKSISDEDMVRFLEAATKRIPELFDRMDIEGLAELMEAAMGGAALEGLRESIHNKTAQ